MDRFERELSGLRLARPDPGLRARVLRAGTESRLSGRLALAGLAAAWAVIGVLRWTTPENVLPDSGLSAEMAERLLLRKQALMSELKQDEESARAEDAVLFRFHLKTEKKG